MKTLKALTIIFGIAVGIVSLLTTQVQAENAKEKGSSKNAKMVKFENAVYDAKMQETEDTLIEDYLQLVSFEKAETKVAIVDQDGKTIFEGEKIKANDLLKNSEYLFSFGEQEHYLIIE